MQVWHANFSKAYYLQQVHQPRHLPRPARFFGPGILEVLFIFCLSNSKFVTLALGLHAHFVVCCPSALASHSQLHLHTGPTPIHLRKPLSSGLYERPSGPHPPLHRNGFPTLISPPGIVIFRLGQHHLDHSGIHPPPVPFPYRSLPSGSPSSPYPPFPVAWCSPLLADGPVSKQDWGVLPVFETASSDRLRLVMPPVLFTSLSFPFTRLAHAVFPAAVANGLIAGAFTFCTCRYHSVFTRITF